MTKKIPYITAGLIFVLSIVLEILLGEGVDSYYFSIGLSGVAALLLFGAAWKRGRNPEKPFYQVILFSLGGLFSPAIAQVLILGFDDIDFAAVAELLLFLSPIVSACVIGYFTRKRNLTNIIRILLNGIPGMMFVSFFIGLEIRECDSLHGFLVDLVPLTFITLVTLLPAYAEAQTDQTERRKIQWNSWRLFLVLEVLVAIKSYSSYFYYDTYCYLIFSTLVRVMLPVLLWHYKKWLNGKEYNQNIRTILYFIGAFLLTILQSGGLRYLMSVEYIYLSVEWMIIGTVVTLIVYWQKPGKFTAAGIIGSIVLAFGNFGLLFATNERLREVFYDLGGPAINIDLSTRADWLGYRMNAIKAYISGDFPSMYGLYSHTSNYGFMWTVEDKFTPYVFPIAIAIFVFVVITAILLVKNAKNQKLASVFAASIILQALISLAEGIALFYGSIGCPFTGYYIVDFVVLAWLLSSKNTVLAESTDVSIESETRMSTLEHKHKCMKTITIVLLCIIAAAECGSSILYNTDIEETVLETYTVTAEDASEWDAAAEQIVQIISEEKPYYIVENCSDLSEEEQDSWADERESFIEYFLITDELHSSTARDVAGQWYIKSSVVHSLLGDDTDFYNERYVPYARLSNLKVKRLDNIGKMEFCINGYHVWISQDDSTDEEQSGLSALYEQVAIDYQEFFSKYDEPVLRYCFADAILSLQNYASGQ